MRTYLKNAVRFSIYAAVAAALFCVGNVLAKYLPGRPVLVPLAAAYIALQEGHSSGACVGGVCGFIAGAFEKDISAYILAYYAFGAAVGYLGERFLRRNCVNALAAALAFIFAGSIIHALPIHSGELFIKCLAARELCAFIVSPAVFYTLKQTEKLRSDKIVLSESSL